jgi:hypothetical protein
LPFIGHRWFSFPYSGHANASTFDPELIATYGRPLIMDVMGEALGGWLVSKCQSVCPVFASTAAKPAKNEIPPEN